MNYLDELVNTIKILRSPEGCEWDRQQTHKSIRQNMLEEAYEAAEAIDGPPGYGKPKIFATLSKHSPTASSLVVPTILN